VRDQRHLPDDDESGVVVPWTIARLSRNERERVGTASDVRAP
jgi:hypothetical protein